MLTKEIETWRGFIEKLPLDEDKAILTKLLNDCQKYALAINNQTQVHPFPSESWDLTGSNDINSGQTTGEEEEDDGTTMTSAEEQDFSPTKQLVEAIKGKVNQDLAVSGIINSISPNFISVGWNIKKRLIYNFE